jgi:hypothetical protein
MRLRIACPKLDDSASMEVARRGNPLPSLPTLSGPLLERDEPIAFGGRSVSDKIGVGRVGALDDADSAQNSDPAARSVSVLNGPMSR